MGANLSLPRAKGLSIDEANVTCSGSMSISSIDLVALFTATA